MAVHLTLKEKVEIIEYKETHSGATFASIKLLFDKKFKRSIGLTTLRNIWKTRFSIRTDFQHLDKKNAKRMSKGKYELVEEALKIWIDAQEARSAPVSDDLIRMKAEQFAKELNMEDFKLSNGTLSRFKERKGYKSYNAVGEMASIDIEHLEEQVVSIKELIKKYDRKDIFNMDETGLYYRMMPSKSISKNPVKGFKKLLDRITIAFTVSMCGEKLRPLVIGHAARPRAFKDFNTEFYVDYTFSTKSWMTSVIFSNYLNNLNDIMKKKGRKILLIVDNCPAHKITTQYTNVNIAFLPPNTTGILQPLDLGIIRSFKCKYRKAITRHVVHLIDNTDICILDAYKRISIKDAIFYSYMAWEDVEPTTIKNCFKQSGLFTEVQNEVNGYVISDGDQEELSFLLKRLNLNLEVNDLIDIDEERVVVCDIEDENIINMIKNTEFEEVSVDVTEDLIDVNDISIILTEENIVNACKFVNQTYEILKHDSELPKEIMTSLMKVQAYCYMKKSKVTKNESLLKWFDKK